jgi:hypothetical protein
VGNNAEHAAPAAGGNVGWVSTTAGFPRHVEDVWGDRLLTYPDVSATLGTVGSDLDQPP